MNAITVDIKTYLEANTTLEFGTDLFINSMPTTPANATTLYNYTAAPLDLLLQDGQAYREPGNIQVLIRNVSYITAYQKAYELIELFKEVHGISINSVVYLYIRVKEGVNEVVSGSGGKSKAGTTILSINLDILREINN